MNNNLPQKYNESFFRKFINKLKVFFSRTKKENTIENIKNSEEKKDLINSLKVDFDTNVSKEYKKKEFMKSLSENPELLQNFSNDKLERILKYYIEENEKKREVLKKIS